LRVLYPDLIKGLAEIVLRVEDLDLMQRFYAETLALPFWKRFGDDMAFFKLSPEVAGRAQALALFSNRWRSNASGHAWHGFDRTGTTLHHFALGVELEGLYLAERLLREAGVPITNATFPWVGWRSIMLQDPEDNVVELVANDPSVLDAGATA
jgi:catechol 2,3-dioxygenase-like lactoylglutathione lyase family enzyme